MEGTNQLHYMDGKWISEQDAKLSVFDLTILRGFGAFDFLRTFNKSPFLLQEHIDRLFNTANEMGITIPATQKEIEDVVFEGIKRSPFPELYIKILVTGGVSSDAITPGKASLIGLFLKAGSYPEEYVTKGIRLATEQYERYIPLAKSLNYMSAVVSLQQARKNGAQEVLYISYDDKILEGTTVNFFAVMNNKLYTSQYGILYGCTRKVILDLAKQLGIEVHSGELLKSQIQNFEEAFITSTTRNIQPVVQIDDQVIGKGVPGPITKTFIDAFQTLVRSL